VYAEFIEYVGDAMSVGETGELVPLKASSAACLELSMFEASEL